MMTEADIYRARVPRRMHRRRIRGCDYAVHEWGDVDAPLLILLHGWGDCGATFQFLVDELSPRWRVLAPDWRGFGDSHCETFAYWFPDYLADLDRLIDLVSPTQAVRLVGHSMGGNVAGLYAGSVPDRVAAFVSLEGFGLPDSLPTDAPGRYRDWLQRARCVDGFATYPDFAGLAAGIARRNPRLSAGRARFVAECWGREVEGEVRLKADPLHKMPNPVLYRRAEADACWRAIRAPSLLLAGADSDIARRVAEAAGSLAAAVPVPGAEWATIPDCGHMLHFDAPRAVAERLDTFLATTL